MRSLWKMVMKVVNIWGIYSCGVGIMSFSIFSLVVIFIKSSLGKKEIR